MRLRSPADSGGGSVPHLGRSSATQPLPAGLGQPGRKTLIKGGAVLSMDPTVGNYTIGDVLIEGAKILAVGAHLDSADAAVIDASGMIVMPGFIDTHHHQFETALRSLLSDAILVNDGRPESTANYYEWMLQKFSVLYRPEDVYISELFG
ncbi:MAG: amidohydrolase, partial [Rhizobium sp.]|nr:amidohydrolase [Rhizobium sp.]